MVGNLKGHIHTPRDTPRPLQSTVYSFFPEFALRPNSVWQAPIKHNQTQQNDAKQYNIEQCNIIPCSIMHHNPGCNKAMTTRIEFGGQSPGGGAPRNVLQCNAIPHKTQHNATGRNATQHTMQKKTRLNTTWFNHGHN